MWREASTPRHLRREARLPTYLFELARLPLDRHDDKLPARVAGNLHDGLARLRFRIEKQPEAPTRLDHAMQGFGDRVADHAPTGSVQWHCNPRGTRPCR